MQHTMSKSMLNLHLARILDMHKSTPGSFCMRPFNTCLYGIPVHYSHSGFGHQTAVVANTASSEQQQEAAANEKKKKKGGGFLFVGCRLGRGMV